MSEHNKNYYTSNRNRELIDEKTELFKQYEAAIEHDLPFEETKKIYLRLKEISIMLKNEKPTLRNIATL